mgnify:CR=1 FL=1
MGSQRYNTATKGKRGGVSVHMDLTGDKKLIAALNSLGGTQLNKIVRAAETKAMRPMAKSAKANAPVETGTLKKSIGVKTKTYRRSGTVVTVVGPRIGFEREVTVETPTGERIREVRNPSKYAHLVEFGTAAHAVKKGAINVIRHNTEREREGLAIAQSATATEKHRGAQKKPFLRPAFDSNKGGAQAILHAELGRGVEKLAKKKA